ncbi:hypothetical protein JNB63_14130 [Microbacterium trichothecenolyticum]|uniref:three-helix bundle dimerization domain-containing protein n=1 Tax=Microbacterium trichothecenolyticum TaxID=69370 RepID=UPI001C6E2B63|nr:hypothetical protein [Microbacterium trichothecenolyticum]MBW9121233.1 hypothetical protein [Microbacterium trichothecenolyticum]
MSATNPETEIEALHHVITRLAGRFPAANENLVREMVAEELIEFDDAWLRTYVPALVEGRVLRRLRGEPHRAAA